MKPSVVLLLGLSGCALFELLEDPPPPNCDPRTAYYPDADGDGTGEPTDMYVGCEAPDGWVTNVAPPGDTDTDGADTDTDVADSDATDTDTGSG